MTIKEHRTEVFEMLHKHETFLKTERSKKFDELLKNKKAIMKLYRCSSGTALKRLEFFLQNKYLVIILSKPLLKDQLNFKFLSAISI